MADLVFTYDPNANVGERLAPEVRAEIAVVAPSTVLNGSITTAKLAEDAVTTDKITTGAVTTNEIAVGGVTATNIASSAVSTAKIASQAVTPDKVGTGVVTSVDSTGATVATAIRYVTAAQYAAISSPDPNTLYFIS